MKRYVYIRSLSEVFLMNNIVGRVRQGIPERNAVIIELCKDDKLHNTLIGTLVKMGCPERDAIDLKTDAIVAFINLCYRPGFEITSSVVNYITGIAKNKFLSRVTKEHKQSTLNEGIDISIEESYEDILISEEKKQLFRQLISQLDERCRQVLILWSQNIKMKKIAVALAYKSEGMARKKKHQCLKRLYDIVHQSPDISDQLRSLL